MGTKGTWRRPTAISDAEAQRRWTMTFTQTGPPTDRTKPTTDLGSEFIRSIHDAAFQWQPGPSMAEVFPNVTLHPPEIVCRPPIVNGDTAGRMVGG